MATESKVKTLQECFEEAGSKFPFKARLIDTGLWHGEVWEFKKFYDKQGFLFETPNPNQGLYSPGTWRGWELVSEAKLPEREIQGDFIPKDACTCSTPQLMLRGCTCGHIERYAGGL